MRAAPEAKYRQRQNAEERRIEADPQHLADCRLVADAEIARRFRCGHDKRPLSAE